MVALCATLHFTHRSKTMEGLQPLHRRVAGIDMFTACCMGSPSWSSSPTA